MNILKPEVTVRKTHRVRTSIFIIAFVASFVASVIMNVSIRVGYDMGRRDAMTGASDRHDAGYACGITTPLDCVLSILIPTRHGAPETIEAVTKAPPRMVHVAKITDHRTCGYFMKLYYDETLTYGSYAYIELLKQVDKCRAHYRATGID